MSNVRDYMKKKKQRDEGNARINYKERIKSHKFTLLYRITLIAILLAACATAFIIQWKNKVYTESVVLSSTENQVMQGSTLVPFGNTLLTYSKDGANCMDAKGNAVWNETFEMQTPMVDICQDVVAIGDYNGRTIYVMNTAKAIGKISTNKPLRAFCVAANGVVAAVLDDTDITYIYLYDAQGNELVHIRTTMKESGYPVSVSISPNGQLVCVSYLYVDSGQMKTSVAFYNFGPVGKNSTDNYVSGYDYLNVVVPFSRFLDNKSIFAVSDDRIMFYSGEQKPVSASESLLSENVRGVYYGQERIGLVFDNTNGESKYRLDVYYKSGHLEQSIPFDLEYTDILFYENQIIIYNESSWCIYNSEGVQKYTGNFGKTALRVIPLDAKYHYMIVTPESIDTVELK